MNIVLLFILFIELHVHYICGVRCSTGINRFARLFLDDNSSTATTSTTTSTTSSTTTTTGKSIVETKPTKRHQKSFNPLKHRSWKYVFDEDCGMSSANRIIGGMDADLGQYPWIARIGYVNRKKSNNEPIFQCGGTLISDIYVLTAAHCVANLPDNMKVAVIRFGEYQTNTTIDCADQLCADEVVDVEPQNIFIHKNYSDPQHGYDIALIRLLNPINITEWISPICLPYGHVTKRNFINETAETAGWGVYELGVSNGSTILQTVKLPILEFENCKKIYKGANVSEWEQLCVGGEIGKDSCNGDSGGPLMKVLAVNGIPRYYLLGVTSFGSKYCGMSAMPAIYTRTVGFLEWILNNIKLYK